MRHTITKNKKGVFYVEVIMVFCINYGRKKRGKVSLKIGLRLSPPRLHFANRFFAFSFLRCLRVT